MKSFKLSILAAALLVGLAGVASANMDGPGRGGDRMMAGMEQVHAKLKLTPDQEAAWKQAQEKSRATMKDRRDAHQKVHEAMKQELAKAEPDFAAVAKVADQTQEANLKSRREGRDQWLKLYATFTPEQKIIARDFMRERMARMEKGGKMGDRTKGKMQGQKMPE